MAIQPSQPQGVGGVLDTAFQLYKSSLATVWPISLLLAIVGVPPTLYSIFERQNNPQPVSIDMLLLSAADPVSSLIGVLSGLLTLWTMSALYLKQHAVGVDADMSVGDALKAAARRLGSMVLATIVVLFAVIVGLALLIVPGLILVVTLMMYMTLLLFENRGAVDSVVASHKLVWGNWWRSSAILTVALILAMVIFVAVGFVAAIAAPFAGLAVDDILMVTMIGELIFNLAFNVLLMPFFTAVMIALYWDLKLRKEGSDLAARVNALNVA